MGNAAKSLQHQIDKFDITDDRINFFIQEKVKQRLKKILDARERMYLDIMHYENKQSFERNSHVLMNEVNSLEKDLVEMLNIVLGDAK